MFWKVVRTLFLIVCCILCLGAKQCCPNGGVLDDILTKERLILAYCQDGSSRIRVRHSVDAQTWYDNDFPNETTDKGVGVANNPSSAYGFASFPRANQMRFVWGLGGLAWDQTAQSPTSQAVLSAPSATYVGDSKWLVAFRKSGDAVAVQIFDSSQRQFGVLDVAPAVGAQNDHVASRAPIVSFGNKIVLVWKRAATNVTLRIASGSTTSTGTPNWTNMNSLSLPNQIGTSCYGPVYSEPALAHDHNQFYLGFTRRTSRCAGDTGEFLSREDFFLYSSADGVNWTLSTQIPGVPLNSFVNIAAFSDGTLVAAFVGSPGQSQSPLVKKLSGGSWTPLNASSVFGRTPKWQQFSLVCVGKKP
jgi:hypothetical protein